MKAVFSFRLLGIAQIERVAARLQAGKQECAAAGGQLHPLVLQPVDTEGESCGLLRAVVIVAEIEQQAVLIVAQLQTALMQLQRIAISLTHHFDIGHHGHGRWCMAEYVGLDGSELVDASQPYRLALGIVIDGSIAVDGAEATQQLLPSVGDAQAFRGIGRSMFRQE